MTNLLQQIHWTRKVSGTLMEINQAESLLLDSTEVGEIAFCLETEDGQMVLRALDTDGTAYHTLQNDPRFCKGIRVIAFLKDDRVVGLRLDVPEQHQKQVETDISRLKDKAMQSLAMPKGELYALLDNFDAESVQAYALALHLKQIGERKAKVLEIADKDAICVDCKETLQVSPRRAYGFSDTYCMRCRQNVHFDLVDPIPREATEDPPSLEEIQARLKMLEIDDIHIGMRFKSLQPIIRTDGIEFPEGSYFRVIGISPETAQIPPMIMLRCPEPGSQR